MDSFLGKVISLARRALLKQSMESLDLLSRYSEQKILHLHGMGPTTIPALKKELALQNQDFRKHE